MHLQVPARTLLRRLPGSAVTTYVAVDLLQSLIDWGEGLAWTPRTARAAGAVRTTEEIAATLRTRSGHTNHSIPVADSIQYPSANQPIPAYALGAWLGDGSVWGAIITSADPEIALHVEAAGVHVVDRGRPQCKPGSGPARTYALRGIRRLLNDLELLRCRDERRRGRNKHIPPNYLLASEEQRRALLAGLLDIDGTVSHTGAVQFDNTNHALALGVHELVCSLGYQGAIRESRATLNGRDCGPKWQVSFTTTDEVFALERKRLVHKERTARVSPDRSRSRYIVDVRPVESVPVRCITVDSPNRLYLVGKSFIPTHNTVTITGVVMEAAARGWPVWMCDPKTVEFIGLRRWPNVQIVATSVADMVVVILRAQQEMERRYAMVEAEQADDDEFEPLILVLDEYRDFMAMVTAWWQSIKQRGMPTKCPVFEAVGSLARKGRTARIHVVMGTQRPDAEFLGGEMRDNFASRMSLGRLSPQGAMMMFEAPYIGVSVPRGVPGRGTAVDDDDVPVEVQGFWTPDPRREEKKGVVEDLAILDRLRPAATRHPKLQVQLAEELLHPIDEDDKSANTGEWQAVLCADLVPALSFDDHNPTSTVSMTKAADATRVPASAPAPEISEDAPGEGEASEWSVDEEYGPEQDVAARRVQPGDRVLVEPALYLWAVCEFAEHDFDDEDLMVIDWRGDGDENGSMTMPDTEIVTVRRPLDPDSEEMSA